MENKNCFEKKRLLLLLLFLIPIFSPFVSAHFVCGQVQNSADNLSSSWMNVVIFYPSNPAQYTQCQVSPQDNKYCCDAEAIPGKTWSIGSVVDAEIYSPQTNYLAGPVSVTTTGNGYDVFPIMQVQKIINVYNPADGLAVSHNGTVLLNASFLTPYTNVSLFDGSSYQTLCTNCTSFIGNIPIHQGTNSWNISATDGTLTFLQNVNFQSMGNMSSSQEIKCSGCGKDSVFQNQEFNLTIKINLSDYANGLLLDEYIPSDFEIIKTDGVSVNSSSYSMIEWNVSGNSIQKTITLKSPGLFWPREYSFETYLDKNQISQYNITVKRFFSFFPSRKYTFFSNNYSIYPLVLSNSPYVLSPSGDILKLAIFPNSTLKNAGFKVISFIPDKKIDGALSYYSIQSNLPLSIPYSVYLEFRVKKDKLYDSGDISMFYYNRDWKEANITLFSEDAKYYYFKGYVQGNTFAIVNSKLKHSESSGNFFSNLLKRI
jgi:hypothetical protein